MRTWTALSLVFLLGLSAGITGCGGGESYGETLSGAAVTPVSDILTDPAAFEGESVTVEGEIVGECPSGCWFTLQDGPATIHVDIAPHGLAIPQKVGSTARVEGKVAVRDGRTMVIGSGVVLR